MNRRRFLMIAAAASLGGSAARFEMNRFSFAALGAHAELTLPGDFDAARHAADLCQQEIAKIEACFSLWKPDSILTRLNQAGRVESVDQRFAELFDYAREIAVLSDGGFDPTVQSLWLSAANDTNAGPVDWRDLRRDTNAAWFDRPGMSATFNGIAQGYAADRVVALLRREGYRSLLANLGEFRGLGARPDGTPWKIGVADPASGKIVATLDCVDRGVATSEPSATLLRGQPHIFDPLSRHGDRWASVTVVADTGWRADALSTAIAAAPITETDMLLQHGGAQRAVLISQAGHVSWWPSKADRAT